MGNTDDARRIAAELRETAEIDRRTSGQLADQADTLDRIAGRLEKALDEGNDAFLDAWQRELWVDLLACRDGEKRIAENAAASVETWTRMVPDVYR